MNRLLDVCGTRSRYNGGCHCADCTEAQRVYHADRRRQVAYGRWDPYVDAGPVREHVRALRQAGLGRARIGELAGVDHGMLWRLENGNPRKGVPPTQRLRHDTAERLLAVSPGDLADAALVDATGTHRRLQALVAVGWSQARLGKRLGVTSANFSSLMQRSRVLASRARAVRELYEEIWDREPECRSAQERLAVTRARRFAAARGWVPPLGWDEGAIDDPAAVPSTAEDRNLVDEVAIERALDGHRVPLNRAEAIEATRIGTERGLSAKEIADLIGCTQRSVVRYRVGAA